MHRNQVGTRTPFVDDGPGHYDPLHESLLLECHRLQRGDLHCQDINPPSVPPNLHWSRHTASDICVLGV